MSVKISVIINTYNEEKNINDCLSCIIWADEVVLVDMYSEDNTVAIAGSFPNVKIFYHEKCGFADPARQFALEKTTNDWVIMLDADERINSVTINRVREIIHSNKIDVIYLPRYNYLMGEVLYCGYQSNESLPRCFKKTVMNYTSIVHQFENVEPNARSIYIKAFENANHNSDITQYIGILHFAVDNFELRIDKINRYTTIEAINIYEKKKKNIGLWRIIFNYPYRLLGNIIWRKGYKQLCNQFMLITTMLFYELATYVKFYYIKKYKSIDYTQKIDEAYKEMSRRLISEYKGDKQWKR